MCDEGRLIEGLSRLGLDERGDGFAEAFIWNANNSCISNRRMSLQYFFHFFWVHLFATGVDALTSTTEQFDRAVSFNFCPVAGNGVANTVDHDECGRGLCFIFVVADRSTPTKCDASALARSRNYLATVFGDDSGVRRQFELRSRGLVLCGRRR